MPHNDSFSAPKNRWLTFLSRLKLGIGKAKSLTDFSWISTSNPVIRYCRRVIDYLIQAVLLLIGTIFFNTVLLYGFRMFWGLYRDTHIGEAFIRSFPEKAAELSKLAYCQPLYFALDLSLSTFFVCFVISAGCQVLHIARYFYYPRNLCGKLIIWGTLLTTINAYFIQRRYQIEYVEMMYALALIPTLCVFSTCFRFAKGLLPELGDLFHWVHKGGKKLLQINYKEAIKNLETLIDKLRKSITK